MTHRIEVKTSEGGKVEATVFEGSGSPEQSVVLLHAFPLTSSMFADMATIITSTSGSGIQLVLPDLPGFGDSDLFSSTPEDMKRYADAIQQVVAALKCEKPVIGGCSMGGYIALEYSRHHETDGLILMDTRTSADTEEARNNRLLWAARMDELQGNKEMSVGNLRKLSSDIDDYFKGLENKLISTSSRRKLGQKLSELIDVQRVTAISHALRAMAGREDTSEHLAGYERPVLVIVGEEDEITPVPQSRTMAERSRRGALRVVGNAGHLSCMEQPGTVAKIIRQWLLDTKSKSGT